MEFSIEFYVSRSGDVPVQDFLEQMRQTDPDDHAAVLRGLAKLRNRQYHRQPLSKALGSGFFELRHLVLYERAAHHRGAWHSQQRPGHPGSRSQDSVRADA
jgi:hypothetical protein